MALLTVRKGEESMDENTKTVEQLQAERAEVRAKYPKIQFPDPVLEPIWYGRRPTNRIPDKQAIVDQVDPENKKVFAVCSKQYKVVHYEDLIGMVSDVVGKLTAYGEIQICPRVLADGGKMQINLKFPDAKHIIAKGDGIIPKLSINSSYDLGWRLSGMFGAFRLSCSNGMGTWQNFQRFTRKHLLNLNINDLKDTIVQGFEVFGIQVDEWKKWSQTYIDAAIYKNMWESLPFSEKEKEAIEILPEVTTKLTLANILASDKKVSLWNLNAAITQYTSHEIKNELRQIKLEPVIAQAMEHVFNLTQQK